MAEKSLEAECNECESTFYITYIDEMVSEDLPGFCPFCGEQIEDVKEAYIDDDDNFEEDEEWN